MKFAIKLHSLAAFGDKQGGIVSVRFILIDGTKQQIDLGVGREIITY